MPQTGQHSSTRAEAGLKAAGLSGKLTTGDGPRCRGCVSQSRSVLPLVIIQCRGEAAGQQDQTRTLARDRDALQGRGTGAHDGLHPGELATAASTPLASGVREEEQIQEISLRSLADPRLNQPSPAAAKSNQTRKLDSNTVRFVEKQDCQDSSCWLAASRAACTLARCFVVAPWCCSHVQPPGLPHV